MSDYITLMGAEQVSNAGHTIRGAADEMKRAASSMEYAFQQHQRFLEDWLQRFTIALETKS